MLRLSNYTIFAELDERETVLVHGYSGAWDVVDAGLARELRRFRREAAFKPLIGDAFSDEPAPEPGEPEIPDELLGRMVKRGYLTELSADEERRRVARMAEGLQALATREPPSYVLALSYACNLACAYCFQDTLRSDPANAPRLVTMSRRTVDRIFAAMPAVEARHGWADGIPEGRSRHFTLFGGEPLLRQTRPLVEYVLAKAKASGPVSIAAITNGTELEHFRDLLGPQGISFLQITLDGAPEEHDRRRIGPGAEATFARIADNIDLALECGAEVKVRINADPSNVDSLPALADVLCQRGWTTSSRFSAYATPVHDSAGTEHDACGFGSWNLTARLDELAAEHPQVAVIDGPDTPWQRRVRDLLRGARDPLLSLQPSFCGAHSQTWVFDAHGDIYACWEKAGFPEERIGRLGRDGTLHLDEQAERTWRGRTVASNPVCGRCPYAFYCGGGCALLAQLKNGKLHSNHCDGFSRRFKRIAAQEVQALKIVPYVEAARAATATLATAGGHDAHA